MRFESTIAGFRVGFSVFTLRYIKPPINAAPQFYGHVHKCIIDENLPRYIFVSSNYGLMVCKCIWKSLFYFHLFNFVITFIRTYSISIQTDFI